MPPAPSLCTIRYGRLFCQSQEEAAKDNMRGMSARKKSRKRAAPSPPGPARCGSHRARPAYPRWRGPGRGRGHRGIRYHRRHRGGPPEGGGAALAVVDAGRVARGDRPHHRPRHGGDRLFLRQAHRTFGSTGARLALQSTRAPSSHIATRHVCAGGSCPATRARVRYSYTESATALAPCARAGGRAQPGARRRGVKDVPLPFETAGGCASTTRRSSTFAATSCPISPASRRRLPVSKTRSRWR